VAAERSGARCTACEYKGAIPEMESESEPDLGEVAV